MSTGFNIHPAIGPNRIAANPNFAGGTLLCNCDTDKVEMSISSQPAHNHACGCTKCWKPEGALFAQIAVAPSDKVTVTANGHKLAVIDANAAIQRHACKECGVHMYGRIENQAHPFFGLDFVHTELSPESGWAPVEFAAFVSSVIESGTAAADMPQVRAELNKLGLPYYDCLSPGLMDYLAEHAAKAKAAR